MKHMKHLVLAFTALIFVLPAPAQASWLLGLSAGGQAGLSHTYGDVDEDSFIIGANARMELLSIIAGEIAIDYRNESLDEGDIRTIPVQLSALFTLLPFVYGTAGFGWYDINVDGDLRDRFGNKDLSNTGWHLGAGIGIPVPGRWSVVGDVRYVFLDYDRGGADFSKNANFYQLTGGLQYKIF